MGIPWLTVSLVLGILLPAADLADSAPATRKEQDRVAQLIAQLGSRVFHEREAATRALDALGTASLQALQAAVTNHDPEVRRRAEQLVRDIQLRVETAQLLEPRRLRLIYNATPLAEAVSDFARKSGYAIQFDSIHSDRLRKRTVTLDTGETTFWQAFDLFCQKAGLSEYASRGPVSSMTPDRATAVLRLEVRGLSSYPSVSGSVDNRLLLLDRPPLNVPTSYAGAVRVKAMPMPQPNRNKDERVFHLEVSAQPNLALQQVLETRITRAIDDEDQKLTAASTMDSTDGQNLTVMANGLLWEGRSGSYINDLRYFPVRLKAPEKPSRVLREVSGVVVVQVQTPLQPVVTIDNILQAAGKTVRCLDGETLTIVEVGKQEDGSWKLRLQLAESPAKLAARARGGRVIQRQRNGIIVQNGVNQENGFPDAKLVLLDKTGKRIPVAERNFNAVFNGNNIAQEMTLTYPSNPNAGEPAKLVMMDRRTLLIDVPFNLKDVPLP